MALMVDKGELNGRIWATIRSLYLNRSSEALPMVVWFYLFIANIPPVLLYSGNRGMLLRKLRWNQWLSQRGLGKKRQRGANLLCLFHPDLSSSPLHLLYSSLSSSSPCPPVVVADPVFPRLNGSLRFPFPGFVLGSGLDRRCSGSSMFRSSCHISASLNWIANMNSSGCRISLRRLKRCLKRLLLP